MVWNKSFTLIELLVVIAIIGLIATVVLVAIGGGGIQTRARITKSLEFSQSLQHSLGAYAVGIWSFDDQTNPTKDGSGYNNNGTISGATYTADTPYAVIGRGDGRYALSFDGVNDYINVPNSASLQVNTAFTVEVWVKPNTNTIDYPVIVSKRSVAYDWDIVQNENSDFMWIVYNGSATAYTVNGGSIVIGQWYHLAGTFNGTTLQLFLNGVSLGTTAFSGTRPSLTGDVTIGAQNQVGSLIRYYNGTIDEVRIYEKALTLGEIQRRYADGLEKHQDLAINKKWILNSI